MRNLLFATSLFALVAACAAAAESDSSRLEASADSVVAVAEAMQAEPGPDALYGAPDTEAAPAYTEDYGDDYAAHDDYASAPPPTAMRCDLDARRTGNGLRLTAYATSDAAAYGEYELVFTKHDAGGSSDIMQGGEFDTAGGHAELGVIETSLERGGRYDARLTVYDADGVACETELNR